MNGDADTRAVTHHDGRQDHHTEWQLRLLGPAELTTAPNVSVRLDRKLAGVLTYLALEGETSRARLAGLLWPDAPSSAARNSLVQCLRKLRRITGADLVTGDQHLCLHGAVRVDASDAGSAYLQGQHARFHELTDRGDLLAHHDFDDCPDFAEWLVAARERLWEWQRDAWRNLAMRAARQGNTQEALAWEDRILTIDPLAEDACQRVMRLHAQANNRHLALEAYDQFCARLEAEMGVPPGRDLQNLARELRTQAPTHAGPPTFADTPISVLRPPVLIGRDEAWARMEDAWRNGQIILIGGEAGVGKTRLAMEFAASKGRVVSASGRPGDRNVPFASLTRMLREGLTPAQLAELPAWVRRELSRLLPESLHGAPLPPLGGTDDKLRLFSAAYEAHLLTVRGAHVVVYDDVQFFDDASSEFGTFLMSRAYPVGATGHPPVIDTFRTNELSDEVRRHVQRLVDSGIAVRVDLQPLRDHDVTKLLESLDMPDLLPLSRNLARFTGGKPLFLLETVRHILESGIRVSEGAPLPLPRRVQDIITHRFERLSPPAQHVARAASVLQTDFTPDLVAQVLNAPLSDVLPAWQELEDAQILSGNHFHHDLVHETIERHAAPFVQAALHRRAARVRERIGAAPARVADHYLRAGQDEAAVPFLLQAAESARAAWRLPEAAAFYERAADVLSACDRHGEAFAVRFTLASEVLKEFDLGERFERTVQLLVDGARTSKERAEALACQSILHHRRGDVAATETAAREGLAHADAAREPDVYADLSNMLGVALIRRGAWEAAITALEQAADLFRRLGRTDSELAAAQNTAAALFQLGRYERTAQLCLRIADQASGDGKHRLLRVGALSSAAAARAHQGLKRAGLALAEDAQALLKHVDGATQHEVSVLLTLGACARDIGMYARALEVLNEAAERGAAYAEPLHALALRQLAGVHALLGAHAHALTLLERVLELRNAPADTRAATYTLLGELLVRQGRSPQAAFDAAESHLQGNPTGKTALRLQIARCALLPTGQAAERGSEVLRAARALEARDLLIVMLTRQARFLQQAGRLAEAAACSTEAVALLTDHDPLEFTAGAVLHTHAAILQAAGDPAHETALGEARAWIHAHAAHVPAPYRAAFTDAQFHTGR